MEFRYHLALYQATLKSKLKQTFGPLPTLEYGKKPKLSPHF